MVTLVLLPPLSEVQNCGSNGSGNQELGWDASLYGAQALLCTPDSATFGVKTHLPPQDSVPFRPSLSCARSDRGNKRDSGIFIYLVYW